MEFIVSENIEVVADGQKVLLEKGDKIVMENNDHVDYLIKQYWMLNNAGNSEGAQGVRNSLLKLGISKIPSLD